MFAAGVRDPATFIVGGNSMIQQSSVIRVMRKLYRNKTDQFEVEQLKLSEVWQAKTNISEHYWETLKVTKHAALRIFQRLNEEEQATVFNEIETLAASGMCFLVLNRIAQGCETEIITKQGVSIILRQNKNRVLIVTVMKRKENNVHQR